NLMQIQVMTDTGSTTAPGEFVEPVQLQVACQTLWQQLPPDVMQITENDLRAFGDVNQALASFYDQAVRSTSRARGVREGKLRRWFSECLITPAGTRGLIYRGPTETEGIPNEVVDELEGRHHLVRSEMRAGAMWYELSHDRFLRPIMESNRRWFNAHAGSEELLV